jgi:pyruvate,water dikinase
VAVRSSATAEDLPSTSFAGQQDTYLNVLDENSLLEAVKRCWSSLWTPRAIAYRMRQSIAPTEVSLAVVVQQMVSAEAAGVLFTANPVTGNRDEVVINAAWGLGETIVGGEVTPDSVLVDKVTGRMKKIEVGDKAVMRVPGTEGTIEVPVASHRRRKPVLTPQQAEELTRLGCQIEMLFGGPQDIEWAIADGRIYILQARPVTRLPKEERPIPGDDKWPAIGEKPAQVFDLWTQADVGEVWPYPVSPLVWSTVPIALNRAMRYSLRFLNIPYLEDIQWAKRFYGRIYFNEGALVHILSQEIGLPSSFMDATFGYGISRKGICWHDKGFRPFLFLRRLPVLLRMVISSLRTGQKLKARFPQIDEWLASFAGKNLSELSDCELWEEFRLWEERLWQVFNPYSEACVSAMVLFSLLERLIDRWCGRKELSPDLVTGLSDVYVAGMRTALWQIAQKLHSLGLDSIVLNNSPEEALVQIQKNPTAQPVKEMLDMFLQHYGHRCPNELEWLNPRWAEAPQQVIELVADYLRAGDRINPVEEEDRQRRRREEAIAWVESHLGPIRRAIFRRVLVEVQSAVRLRDNSRHYITKITFPIRRIYAVLGQRWASRGWLREPNDIFFLSLSEIEAVIEAGDLRFTGLALSRCVAERRKAYEYWFDVVPPEVIGSDGKPVLDQVIEKLGGAVLRGIPASGGQVRGKARVIHDYREATRLQEGDILVTRATDPGWTPLFPLVSGLVIEVGGQLSHGAIVAREYGVPAVVNVRNATRCIRDGQTIIVDGTAGRVYLVD